MKQTYLSVPLLLFALSIFSCTSPEQKDADAGQDQSANTELTEQKGDDSLNVKQTQADLEAKQTEELLTLTRSIYDEAISNSKKKAIQQYATKSLKSDCKKTEKAWYSAGNLCDGFLYPSSGLYCSDESVRIKDLKVSDVSLGSIDGDNASVNVSVSYTKVEATDFDFKHAKKSHKTSDYVIFYVKEDGQWKLDDTSWIGEYKSIKSEWREIRRYYKEEFG